MLQLVLQEVGDLTVDAAPIGNGQVIALVFGHQTLVVLIGNQCSSSVAFRYEFGNLIKVQVVVLAGRHGSSRGEAEGLAFHAIGDFGSFLGAVFVKYLRQNLFQLLL